MTIPNINNIELNNDTINVDIANKKIEDLPQIIRDNIHKPVITIYDSGWEYVRNVASAADEITVNLPDYLIPFTEPKLIVEVPETHEPIGMIPPAPERISHITDPERVKTEGSLQEHVVITNGSTVLFDGKSHSYADGPYSIDQSDWKTIAYPKKVWKATFTWYTDEEKTIPNVRYKNAEVLFFERIWEELELQPPAADSRDPKYETMAYKKFGPSAGNPSLLTNWTQVKINGTWRLILEPPYFHTLDSDYLEWMDHDPLNGQPYRGFEILSFTEEEMIAVGSEQWDYWPKLTYGGHLRMARLNRTRTINPRDDEYQGSIGSSWSDNFYIKGIRQKWKAPTTNKIGPDEKDATGQWIPSESDYAHGTGILTSQTINLYDVGRYEITDIELAGYYPMLEPTKTIRLYTGRDKNYSELIGNWSPNSFVRGNHLIYDYYADEVLGVWYDDWSLLHDIGNVKFEYNSDLQNLWYGPPDINFHSERRETPTGADAPKYKVRYLKNEDGTYTISYSILGWLGLANGVETETDVNQLEFNLNVDDTSFPMGGYWYDVVDVDNPPYDYTTQTIKTLGSPVSEFKVKTLINVMNPFYYRTEHKVDNQKNIGSKADSQWH